MSCFNMPCFQHLLRSNRPSSPPPSNTPHPASSGQTAAGLVVPSPPGADESNMQLLPHVMAEIRDQLTS